MKTPFTGGCACGAVRYEGAAEPLAMFQCHCRDCQQASGGACTYIVLMSADSFRFTLGTPRYHFTNSERMGKNKHKRGFCPECGSRLTGGENRDGTTGVVGISAASLDDPSEFRAAFHVFTSDAQSWDHMNSGLPRYEQYSPS